MDITLAIDAMGGDHGPHVIIPAALKAIQFDDQLN
ncbi:MAG: phosphate acyltransferase, partial [Methylotenera sp.]|nr:phosphate acyltransferase [Methylotenera sp.]